MKIKIIRDIYKTIEKEFPISDYIDSSKYGLFFIASQISKLFPNGGKLLDIGCGPLNKTALFAKMGYECFACDDFSDYWHRDSDNLSKIRIFAKKNNITLHIFENNSYSIPFDEASFDIVCLFDIIEHLHESPRNLLNSAGKMLRQDGILVVTMPSSVNLRKRLRVLLGLSNYPPINSFYNYDGFWRGHVREYTLKETNYILRANGYEIVYSKTYNRLIEKKIKNKLLRFIYMVFIACFPGCKDSILVIGRKPIDWQAKTYSEKDFMISMASSVPDGVLKLQE